MYLAISFRHYSDDGGCSNGCCRPIVECFSDCDTKFCETLEIAEDFFAQRISEYNSEYKNIVVELTRKNEGELIFPDIDRRENLIINATEEENDRFLQNISNKVEKLVNNKTK